MSSVSNQSPPRIDLTKINSVCVIKTVRGALKKAIFFFGANVPYAYTETLVDLSGAALDNYLSRGGKNIREIVETEILIRYYDDILDNQLARKRPLPVKDMRNVIRQFTKAVPGGSDIAALFSQELDILAKPKGVTVLQKKITRIIDIRPSDYFLLIRKIIKQFGTRLSTEDYRRSWKFFADFQRLRDLLDDMMSVEEDEIKNDYNSVVIAKRNHLPYHFFEEIVFDKLEIMKSSLQDMRHHPQRSTFHETIAFWEQQYRLLFKRLLMDYYIDLNEFRESYFIIKQL